MKPSRNPSQSLRLNRPCDGGVRHAAPSARRRREFRGDQGARHAIEQRLAFPGHSRPETCPRSFLPRLSAIMESFGCAQSARKTRPNEKHGERKKRPHKSVVVVDLMCRRSPASQEAGARCLCWAVRAALMVLSSVEAEAGRPPSSEPPSLVGAVFSAPANHPAREARAPESWPPASGGDWRRKMT